MTTEPVHVVKQRGARDCGVACLEMLLQVPYEDILDAIVRVNGRGAKTGLMVKEVINAAALLGHTLVRRRAYDLSSDVGILSVRRNPNVWHYVILKEGQILDPADGTAWNAQTYLDTHKMKACTLIQEDE